MTISDDSFLGFNQSAINGITAGGDINIGDVSQIINISDDLLSGQKLYLMEVFESYKQEQEKIKSIFKNNQVCNRDQFYQELSDYIDNLEYDINERQVKVRRYRQDIKYRQYIGYRNSYREEVNEINQLISDVQILKNTKRELLSPTFALNLLEQDGIFGSLLGKIVFSNLTVPTKSSIGLLVFNFTRRKQDLEKQYEQDTKIIKEKKIGFIFEVNYIKKLNQHGYPLRDKIRKEIVSPLQDVCSQLDIEWENVASIEKIIVKPFYEANFKKYIEEYRQKLEQEGYPLKSSTLSELESKKNSLGLELHNFTDFDLQKSEIDIIKPFYHKNIRRYEQEIQLRNENNRSINYNYCDNLRDLKQALGLTDSHANTIEVLVSQELTINYILDSEIENEYWRLLDLLINNSWKEADEQTRKILLKKANREKSGYLNKESINNFPITDLILIDCLWEWCSKKRFGLRLQKRIYDAIILNENTNNHVQRFAERVGWSKKAGFYKGLFAWKKYHDLIFTLDAPKGHLPVWGSKDRKIIEKYYFHIWLNRLQFI